MRVPSICVLLLAAALTTACASGPRPVHERGWVGGDLLAVVDGNDWLGPWHPGVAYEPVVGMPQGVAGRRALLVREAHADTPLGRAGLLPGDLLLEIVGEEVGSALELHERVEDIAPGVVVTARVWSAGEVRDVPVTVGRERYERVGSLAIGIGFPFWSPVLDVWPFDDGIDILGLLVLKHDPVRRQAVDVRGAYLARVAPDAPRILPPQEQTVFRVFPVTIGRAVHVVEQSAD